MYSITKINFSEFLEGFKLGILWYDMENTVEGSKFHREANVATHTTMLLDHYYNNFFEHRTEKQRMLSLVSCVFHDVGKSRSMIMKFSEERGHYKAFHGHEKVSANLWIDYAYSNSEIVKDLLGLSFREVHDIAQMIEFHLPFELKNKQKREALKTSLIKRLGVEGHQAWLDFILCDQHGRIAEDQETKLAKVDVWMKEWDLV